MNNQIKILPILCIFCLPLIYGCNKKDPETIIDKYPFKGRGFFLVNEGNYTWGNGMLQYFSYDSLEVYDNVFETISGRPLGDIPLRIKKHNEKLYIVVNNSGRIEILDLHDQSYVASIDGLISPRDIAFLDNDKAIVSSLYSDSLAIVDLNGSYVSGYVNIGKSSEQILVHENSIYVSNWSGGSTITVLNKSDLSLNTTIATGLEPSDIVLDKSGMIRALCSGGYLNMENPSLITIDPDTKELVSTITFNDISNYPTELIINGTGDTLYYLNNGVFAIGNMDQILPEIPIIDAENRNLYRLGFDTAENMLIVSDAVDYVQNGYFYIYSTTGIELGSYRAGIIPGKMCFN